MENQKLFISPKENKRQFRAVGLSINAAAQVEKLKKFADGEREKVKSIDVRRVIREAAESSSAPEKRTTRPIKWKAEEISAMRTVSQ